MSPLITPSANGAGILSVVVRFVPYDQWFVTHIALSWTIAQVKSWILAKCFGDYDTLRILSVSLKAAAKPNSKSHKRKSSSPIKFAPGRFTDPSYQEDNVNSNSPDFYTSDDDQPRRNPYISRSRSIDRAFYPPSSNISPRSSISSHISSQPTQQPTDYSLVSFSSSYILEDHHRVSWYNIHPNELLEVHSSGSIVRFTRNISSNIPRDSTTILGTQTSSNNTLNVASKGFLPSFWNAPGLSEYVQPYFQAPVKVLRVLRQHAPFLPQDSPSTIQEELSSSMTTALASSSFSGAGKRLKSGHSNNYDVTLATTVSGETVKVDATAVFSGSIAGVTNDYSMYNKVSTAEQSNIRRKGPGTRTRLVWQDRWIIIRNGVLNLCERKEDIENASHSSKLSAVSAIRGVEYLANNPSAFSIPAGLRWRNDPKMKKRIVCISFQARQGLERKGSSVSSNEIDAEEFDRKGHENCGVFDKEDHTRLVIDMVDETAFDHVIRVLHRLAPSSVTSSFLNRSRGSSNPTPFFPMSNLSQGSIHGQPSHSSPHQSYHAASDSSEVIDSPLMSGSPPQALYLSTIHETPRVSVPVDTSSAAPRSSSGSHGTLRSGHGGGGIASALKYPDWRFGAVIRAQRAGLGDAWKGIGSILLGSVEGSESKGIERIVQIRSQGSNRSTDRDGESSGWNDSNDEESELSSSETEWDGWKEDLILQWTSIVERPEQKSFSAGGGEVDFSDYCLEPGTDDIVRRVNSDAGRPLLPLSLTMPNLAATMPVLWSPLLRTPGAVTTSAVSIGRSSVRKRSSTVTGSLLRSPPTDKRVAKAKSEHEKDRSSSWWGRSKTRYTPSTLPSHAEDAGFVSSETSKPDSRMFASPTPDQAYFLQPQDSIHQMVDRSQFE